MKLTTLAILCAACMGLNAHAQLAAQQAAPQTPDESLAAAKARLGKGGRVSPMERAQLAKAEAVQTNGQVGESFLEKNRKVPGVKVLPSGVQYRILKTGTGKKPLETGKVRAHYEGRLVDGTVFDKIEDKAGSVLLVKGLVAGLKEAVKTMPAGSKWEVVVPPALGYGASGTQGVGPNAVLIYQFEVMAAL